MDSIIWIAIVLLLTGALIAILGKKKKAVIVDENANSLSSEPADAPHAVIAQAVPDQIVIGQTPSAPLVTIETLPDLAEFQKAKPLEAHSSKPISRLSALIQAVPSMLVAGEAHGKKFMEVVINGDLVRATDGNGLRPFAMSGGKITEQARLFEADKLQNMINAAAIWQIASVVVAQKHLADISQKLDEIKDGVNKLSEFLDNQRKARIQGTYDYLGQVYSALRGGDLPEAARTELENCERDLLEIQVHLDLEYQQKIHKRVDHAETFGTEDLANGIGEKMSELETLATDIALCMRTRIAAWHVLSLFPGDPHLKIARKQSIEKSICSFSALGATLKEALFKEISEIKSFWNKESTLQERRNSLQRKCRAVTSVLEDDVQKGTEQISRSESLLLKHDQPSRLIIQVENGQLIEARQAA